MPDEVEFKVESPDPSRSTASKFQAADLEAKTPASDNTEVSEPAEQESVEKPSTAVEEPKEDTSRRYNDRVQTLANKASEEERKRLEAEARANQSEEMLRRMVNSQPVVSEEDQLAKQFKSYDSNIGYPTDPKEYAQYVGVRAEHRAELRAQETNRRDRDQREMADLMAENPKIGDDQLVMAAIAAKKATNPNISYLSAYKQVQKDLADRLDKEVSSRVAEDNQAKDEAYVETTKGASTNRGSGSTPSAKDVANMSLDEMEAALKNAGMWDE